MSKGKLAVGVALALFAIYVVAAPYITVYQMRSAAERQDGEALSEHIEFPSVRQGLKDQMNAMFAKKMIDNGMMIDAYVTPSAITQLMAGEKPLSSEEKGDSRSSNRKPFSDVSMSYKSLDRFVVTVKGEDGDEGKFVFRRRGIDWKLTNIIIPMDAS